MWGWDATTSGNYYPLCSVALNHALLSLLEQFAGAWTQRSLCERHPPEEGFPRVPPDCCLLCCADFGWVQRYTEIRAGQQHPVALLPALPLSVPAVKGQKILGNPFWRRYARGMLDWIVINAVLYLAMVAQVPSALLWPRPFKCLSCTQC